MKWLWGVSASSSDWVINSCCCLIPCRTVQLNSPGHEKPGLYFNHPNPKEQIWQNQPGKRGLNVASLCCNMRRPEGQGQADLGGPCPPDCGDQQRMAGRETYTSIYLVSKNRTFKLQHAPYLPYKMRLPWLQLPRLLGKSGYKDMI